ncbi:MAG: WecB/TagA/CpsF family glycosyltransferase [Cyanobacteria bacterium J06554_11]
MPISSLPKLEESNLPKRFHKTQNVIGFPISAEPFTEQVNAILNWGQRRLSKVVCVANVHMLIEAKMHKAFAHVLHKADLLTPDGMPLVWLTGWFSGQPQDRVAGMELMLNICKRATERRVSLFFLGSTSENLQHIRARLQQEFPDLTIAGMEELPFRPLTPEEDGALIRRLNDSDAGIIFLSLGCPKQEKWMHQHRGKVKAVMIGVGGVFPVYAGLQKWAPRWVRKSGLEWAYRLFQEPKRLWKRYASTIPVFIWLAIKQVIKFKLGLDPDRSLRQQFKESLQGQ